jgi:glycine/D-amino acid oxidase-like deaminating enzyme
MKQFDYIIVGMGIAGLSVAESLRKRGLSFIAFDPGLESSTKVAGGVVNPIVIKRLNPAWRAGEFLAKAREFYQELNHELGAEMAAEVPVRRPFSSVEEQNQWLVGTDRRDLRAFLDPVVRDMDIKGVSAPYGVGTVKDTLRIDTSLLYPTFQEYLRQQDKLLQDAFHYEDVSLGDQVVEYHSITARRLVFCEGVKAGSNPFFPTQALLPKKGEYLTIEAPGLEVDSVIKGHFFLIPLGDHRYKVGATFAHGDDSPVITEKGRHQMVTKLRELLQVDFKVIDQEFGFRPTVSDRRPLVGRHPSHEQLAFLNGLGTRGLLMAPLLAQWLIAHLEDNTSLPQDVDISRKF